MQFPQAGAVPQQDASFDCRVGAYQQYKQLEAPLTDSDLLSRFFREALSIFLTMRKPADSSLRATSRQESGQTEHVPRFYLADLRERDCSGLLKGQLQGFLKVL